MRLKNFFRIVAGSLLGAYLLLLLFLNIGPTQRFLTERVAQTLSAKLNTKVELSDFEVGLFNRVVLRGLKLYDQQGQTMLQAGTLTAKIALRPLLGGQISLRTVSLLDADVKLYRDSAQADPNFQFVVDAFASEGDEPAKTDLRINSIILCRLSICYDDRLEPATPGTFNPAHLCLENVDANLSLKRWLPDSLSLRVRSLSFKERSGLNVQQLGLQIEANRRGAVMKDFLLKLPHTTIAQPRLALTYDADSLFSTLRGSGTWRNVIVDPRDLACFIPELKQISHTLEFNTDFDLKPGKLALRSLSLSGSNNLLALNGNATLTFPGGKPLSVSAPALSLSVNAPEALREVETIIGAKLPQELAQLGHVAYRGAATYGVDGVNALKGVLETAVGALTLDLRHADGGLTGTASSDGIALNKLLGTESDLPSLIAFSAKADVRNLAKAEHADIQLAVPKINYGGHTYSHVALSGKWNAGRYEIQARSADPSADFELHAAGKAKGWVPASVQGGLKVANLAVDRFLKASHLRDSRVSFSGRLSANTFEPSQMTADLGVSDFLWKRGDEVCAIDHLSLQAEPSERGTHMQLQSSFLDAGFDGQLSLPKFRQALMQIAERAMPGLETGEKKLASPQEWMVGLNLKDAKPLQQLLNVPLSLQGPLTLHGNLQSEGVHSVLTAHTAGLEYDGTELKNLRLYFRDENRKMSLLVQGEKELSDMMLKFAADLKGDADALRVNLNWTDVISGKFRGELDTRTLCLDRNVFSTELFPSEILIGDSIWDVHHGRFVWGSNHMEVDSFKLSHLGQSLSLNGAFASQQANTLHAHLEDLQLEYIFDLLDFHPVDFAGRATGDVSLSFADGDADAKGKLDVSQFKINNGLLGRLNLDGHFDATDGSLKLAASIAENAHTTLVNGNVSIANDTLDLYIESDGTRLDFMGIYFENFLDNFTGRAYGKTRLYGPFDNLDLEGDNWVSGGARILANGVNYRIDTAHVSLLPGDIHIEQASVSDGISGSGLGMGRIQHTGLGDFYYGFYFDIGSMLLYDRPQSADIPFDAKAYGSGAVQIEGRPNRLEALISVQPDSRTRFSYAMDTPDDYSQQELLTFQKRSDADTLLLAAETPKPAAPQAEEEEEDDEGTTDIYLNVLIDMQPDVPMRLIMDEKSGDDITAYGSGNIHATWFNKGAFNLYGTYTLSRGIYRMSVQDVIRKDFHFQPGGTVVFNGKPFDARLDLQAIYTVNSASLSDLSVATSLSDNSVKVNCLLNFAGHLQNPQVRFDLDLPSASEDVKQMVRSLISTEEEMNQQILYLLGVGRFYTFDFAQVQREGQTSQTASAMNSLLSNTLSSQLNDIIQNAVASSNWTIGTNLSTGNYGWRDMEVEGILSGRLLNNRLLFNGNLGYRERMTQTTGTNFVGDFDLQYLLTPKGTVRLKAYSQMNDRYFTKNTLTTQGIGIMVQHDFNSFADIFKSKKRKAKSAAKNK